MIILQWKGMGFFFLFFCHSLISACVLRGLGHAEQASSRVATGIKMRNQTIEEVGKAQDVQLATQTACDTDPESFFSFLQKCFTLLLSHKGKSFVSSKSASTGAGHKDDKWR